MGKLTATAVKALVKKPGRHGDGDGLFLEVGRNWRCLMGCAGPEGRPAARHRAWQLQQGSALPRPRSGREVRAEVGTGLDPVLERQKAAGVPTFRVAAGIVHAEQKNGLEERQASPPVADDAADQCLPDSWPSPGELD